MTDVLQAIPEDVALEIRPDVAAFREKVAKADGSLIPLRKNTSDGKKLYIAVRHLRNPGEEKDEDVNPWFYGFDKDMRVHLPLMTGVLLIDVYGEKEEQIRPLGHMDWYSLHDDYANGGGNMHEAAVPRSEHEKLARNTWEFDNAAFKVDYVHHREGIGSLMLATSAVVLPKIGVKNFYTGAILEPAQKTYARFGIKPEDFTGRGYNRHLPIERLSQHPQVNKAIAEFI